MQLTKYDKYKESGIEWLGEVPADWVSYRINYISKLVRGNTGFKKDELLNKGEYVALQYGKTYKVDEVDNSFEYFVNDEFYKKSQLTDKGDTILISTSETLEDLGHSCFYNRNDLGLIGGEQILLKPYEKLINGKYLYYFSKKFSPELRKYAKGLKVFRFNVNNLKQIFLATPSVQEQTQIATYLDQQTARIDKKIDLLTQKITHYKALKTAIINKAVTKGLDDSVEMKDSGVDWIGEIPKHWEDTQMKRILSLLTDYDSNGSFSTIKGNVNRVEDAKKQFAWFVRATDFTNFEYKKPKTNFVWVDKASYEFLRKSYLSGGELLIAKRGEIGKVYLMPSVKFPSTLGPNMYLARFNQKEIASKFIFYYFKTSYGKNQLMLRNKSTTIGAIYKDDFKSIGIFLPPKEEQLKIVDYLNQKTTILDKILTTIKTQIQHQKDLRKTLINDVVTGKVKVTKS